MTQGAEHRYDYYILVIRDNKEIIQELNIPNLKIEDFIRLKIGD